MPIQVHVRRLPAEWLPSPRCYALVKSFEGFSPVAYPDPASPLGRAMKLPEARRLPGWETLSGAPITIGWGHTGPEVQLGMTCTLEQANVWLDQDMIKHTMRVRAAIPDCPVTQFEMDALVAIDFNLKGGVPKTMRAYLQGGVTDKGVQVGPCDYKGALYQFPRNCRAGGVPMLGLLRRRLAEACLFSDLPWENACSKNIVRLTLKEGTHEIDPDETTSLEDTLDLARRDVPAPAPVSPPVFKPDFPRREVPKREPSVTVIVDKPSAPEPAPEPAASPYGDDAVGEGPSPSVAAPNPAPTPPSPVEALAPADGPLASGEAQQPQAPQPSGPVVAAPLPVPPVGTKPLSPNTKKAEEVPYKIDPNAGLKPMEETKRFVGAAIMMVATILRSIAGKIGAASGSLGTGIAAFLALADNPATQAIIVTIIGTLITIIVCGAVWVVAFIADKIGLKIKKAGEREATQGMY